MSRWSDAVQADAPIAWWRLNEISGDAQDSSGYGHDAQKTGGVTYRSPGLLGSDSDTAMILDGATGYLQTPYSTAFDLSALTVEALVKIGAAGNGGLFSKTIGGAVNSQYQLFIEGGVAKLRIHSTATDYTIGTGALSLNVPHHIVATYDPSGSGTMRTYVDGVQTDVSGVAVPAPNTGNGVAFLGALNASTYLLAGTLDEVAVYGSVLSPTRIQAHYQAFLALSGFDLTSCMDGIAAYAMSQGVTTRAYGYPHPSPTPPCLVVGYPTRLDFDLTFHTSGTVGRVMALFPLRFIVGLVVDKASRDALSVIISGAAGIKNLLDGSMGGSFLQTARVVDLRIEESTIGDARYLDALFDLEVIA